MPDAYNPDHLRALLSAASPRPWHRGTGDHYGREVRDADGDGIAWCGGYPTEQAHADAAVICAAVNALPALLDRVRELEAALNEAADLLWDGTYWGDGAKAARAGDIVRLLRAVAGKGEP